MFFYKTNITGIVGFLMVLKIFKPMWFGYNLNQNVSLIKVIYSFSNPASYSPFLIIIQLIR